MQKKQKIDKLNDAFSNLYPRMTKELETISENRYYFRDIFNDHYSEFEAYKKSMEKQQEKLERQKSCQHMFHAIDNKLRKAEMIKCEKCGYSIIKRKPGVKPKGKQ